jgi:ATP-dependent Clp protease adaptor protein ClpS
VEAWVFLSPRSRRFIAPLRVQAQALSINGHGSGWHLRARAKPKEPTLIGQASYSEPPTVVEIDSPLEGTVWSELVSDAKICLPSMWNIVFYNDDYTPMDFVEFVLKTVFHMSALDALALALAVHTKGKGIPGTYTFEVAEQKQSEVLLMAKVEEHPLRVEVERV